MRMCLSSDAYPAGDLGELSQAARRRALSGLELRIGAGHGHDLDETFCTIRQQEGLDCLPGDHAPIEWLIPPRDVTLMMLMIWAGAADSIGAGLILEEPVSRPPAGVKVALLHRNDPTEAEQASAWAGRHNAYTCWQVDPELEAADVQPVLSATIASLAHVRLIGSGPEADRKASPATGALMGQLALAGYTGTISLVPSPDADPEAWRRWLFEVRGWGCGTAAQKHERAKARRQLEVL